MRVTGYFYPMQNKNILLGVLLIIFGELLLLAVGMIIKTLTADGVPTEQMVFLRSILSLALLMPWLMRKGISRLYTQRIGLHIARGVLGVTAMMCVFYSWGNLPLAQASLLKQTSPLFISIIAFLWLRESLGNKTIFAIITGFIGVALIIDPGAENTHFNIVIFVALAGAMLAGSAKVVVRRMSTTETPGRIVFYFSLIGTLVSAVPASWVWMSLSWLQVVAITGIAVLSTTAQLAITKAFSYAPAGQIGFYTYTSVAFAALFGWLIWNEVLSWQTILGILVIVAAGVLAALDKSQPKQPCR